MNKNAKVYVILAIGVLCFVFFWFEVRPSQIRKNCYETMVNDGWALTGKAERERLGWDMNKINAVEREKGDFWYNDCLHEHGLTK